MRHTILIAVLALASGFLASVPAQAQTRSRRHTEIIERVVAVVNDEAVFLSELRRRAMPFLDQALGAPTEVERMARLEQLYNQMLDHLVDEELIQQAARRMQVRVTSEDVERAIGNVRRQSGLTEEDFWGAVRGQGFTEAQYRLDVRRQLLRLKVLNNRVRGRVNLTEADVRRRYEQEVRRANRDTCFHVSAVVIPFADGASATGVAAARAEGERLRAELTPETFEQRGGSDLGRLCQGELSPTAEDAIASLQPGQISDPVRGESGYHLFLLRRRERGASSIPPYDQVREQWYRQMLEEAMQRQEQIYLQELRREAVLVRRL